MLKNEKKVVSVAVKPTTRSKVVRLSEITGKKKYVIIQEAVDLWERQKGSEQ